MWFSGWFENPFVDTVIDVVLPNMHNMWFGALIASAILTAFFLIITLARMEAGLKAKSRWLALTFCSFAVMAGLVFIKPKANMDPIEYMPATPPAQENTVKPKDTATKKTVAQSTSSGGDKSPGLTANTPEAQGQAKVTQEKNQEGQGSKGVSGQKQGESSIQEQLERKVEYRDPVLEEILEFKRQAEENSKQISSEESTEEEFSDSGSFDPAQQQQNNQGSGVPVERIDLFTDGKTNNQITDKSELGQKMQTLPVTKARVLTPTLNVRDKGSLEGRIIGTLKTDDIVEVTGQPETGEWISIRLTSGQTGWVMKKYITVLR